MEKNKSKVKIIYIVLCYRNYEDLIKLCISLKNKNTVSYQIIVVNSFYDLESEKRIKDVANQYECIYINRENRGYGYGNNEGIVYARENFDFDFLIISNPDIEVDKLFIDNLDTNNVYAPKIINNKGINQNPFRLTKNLYFDKMKYIGFKYNLKFLVYLDIVINKIMKKVFYLLKINKIYACHGSFFVIGSKALNKLPNRVFLDDMFLFAEEDWISRIFQKNNIDIYLTDLIQVRHFEDGSVKFLNNNIFDLTRDSYMKYYEYWSDYNV